MLLLNAAGFSQRQWHAGEAIPAETRWFDLFDPTEEECRAVEQATGLRVPVRAEIVEIERSSRLRQEGGGVYLSTPMTAPAARRRVLTALGIVLSEQYLITQRYLDLPVFSQFALAMHGGPDAPDGLFIGLLEAVVDRLADLLEHAGAELETLSRRIFHTDGEKRRQREDKVLLATLRQVGLAGDSISNLRDALLGIGRILPFTLEVAPFLSAQTRQRAGVVRQDIASLSDYDAQLITKVQFLLDATLGFLNIQQNDGIKVLTVVSVVGIPPTLIASIYGMNFKNMPELGWAYGYPYGLGVILLSILLPLAWFRFKRWI